MSRYQKGPWASLTTFRYTEHTHLSNEGRGVADVDHGLVHLLALAHARPAQVHTGGHVGQGVLELRLGKVRRGDAQLLAPTTVPCGYLQQMNGKERMMSMPLNRMRWNEARQWGRV